MFLFRMGLWRGQSLGIVELLLDAACHEHAIPGPSHYSSGMPLLEERIQNLGRPAASRGFEETSPTTIKPGMVCHSTHIKGFALLVSPSMSHCADYYDLL